MLQDVALLICLRTPQKTVKTESSLYCPYKEECVFFISGVRKPLELPGNRIWFLLEHSRAHKRGSLKYRVGRTLNPKP